MSESTDKGGKAEIAIFWAATRLDVVVARPTIEGRRYDLIFDIDGVLLRVQCKWANRRGDVVVAYTGTSRHTPRGYVRTTYAASEIDAIALYCADLDRSFLLPIEEFAGQSMVHLRLCARTQQPARADQDGRRLRPR